MNDKYHMYLSTHLKKIMTFKIIFAIFYSLNTQVFVRLFEASLLFNN